MQTGRKDLFWHYAAVTMRVASGIIVLPVTLRLLPSEDMGVWTLFLSLTTIVSLLDFGFSNSFSRNVTYIFSGVKELKTKGYAEVQTHSVDYGLLKNLLKAVRLYYGAVALIFLAVFVVAGPFYLSSAVLCKYTGNHLHIWVAWFILGIILSYELYTYYYVAILAGQGKIKKVMQIVVISQSIRIMLTVTLLLLNFGLLALVIGMLVGDLIHRMLSSRAFFDKETKQQLMLAPAGSAMDTIKIMAPNSVKLGLTAVGHFLRSRATMLIAPYYLTLSEVGSYGISRQMVDFIIAMSMVWFVTFYPQLSQYCVQKRTKDIKRLYIKSLLIAFIVFALFGCALVLFGNPVIEHVIHGKTFLLCSLYLILLLLFSFLEVSQNMATNILLAKNEVPFFKSTLFSGALTVLLLWLMLRFTGLGILSLILSYGIAMSVYVNWKWPVEVWKVLKIKPKDFVEVIKTFWKENTNIKKNSIQ
ncbi:MAG: hypothetical protein LBS01_04675 [Prevotellaceae bacterium]|jgi:O-antigen/teichoic acid export membrane protein|nr:hypothetical protein [Prevotellaceae bacterium]